MNPKYPGKNGPPVVRRDDLLNAMTEEVKISEGFVSLVSSTAEFGEGHDWDVFLKTADLVQNIKFAISRRLPPNEREHIHFIDGKTGPFTSFFELYDLVLVPSDNIQKHQFAMEGITSGIEVKATVLSVHKVAKTDKVYNYTMGIDFGTKDVPVPKIILGKMSVCRTFNTLVRAGVGDTLTLLVHTVTYYTSAKGEWLRFYGSKVAGKTTEKTNSWNEIVRKAKKYSCYLEKSYNSAIMKVGETELVDGGFEYLLCSEDGDKSWVFSEDEYEIGQNVEVRCIV